MSSSFYVQPTILVHWKKKTYKHIMRAANLQSIFDAKWLEKNIFSIKKIFFFSSLSILLPFRNKLLTSFSYTAMRRKAYQLINKFPLVFFLMEKSYWFFFLSCKISFSLFQFKRPRWANQNKQLLLCRLFKISPGRPSCSLQSCFSCRRADKSIGNYLKRLFPFFYISNIWN